MRGQLAESIVLFCALALAAGACGSEEATAPTAGSAISTSTIDVPRPGPTAPSAPAVSAPATSMAPEAQSTLPPVATDSSTTVESTDTAGVPLAQILEPYEAAALGSSDFTAYRFDCRRYTGERRSDWQGWEFREIDRDRVVGRGAVLSCGARTDPPADVGSLDLVVLDDRGTTTGWRVGSDGMGHVPVASEALLCREYMATEDFGRAMEWMGRSAPWSDDVLAFQWAVAYWFLEGEPDRMDIDGNGIPCELLFDTAVVAEVWTSDSAP